MKANCGKVSTMFPDHFVNYVPDRSDLELPARNAKGSAFAKAHRSLLLRALRAGIELVNELLERNSMNTRRPAERHEPRGDCEEPSPHVRTTMAAEHFKRRRPSRQNCPN